MMYSTVPATAAVEGTNSKYSLYDNDIIQAVYAIDDLFSNTDSCVVLAWNIPVGTYLVDVYMRISGSSNTYMGMNNTSNILGLTNDDNVAPNIASYPHRGKYIGRIQADGGVEFIHLQCTIKVTDTTYDGLAYYHGNSYNGTSIYGHVITSKIA